MSGITWAPLGEPLVGVGLAPGLGAGFAAVVEEADVPPPHPAIAVKAAIVKTTRLGRSSFFSSFIRRGTLFRVAKLTMTFCGVYREAE
jgi:hypothetical protein